MRLLNRQNDKLASSFRKKTFRSLEKLSNPDRERFRKLIDDRLLTADNPRSLGKALSGSFSGLWRYRIGHIRMVVQAQDEALVILVLKIGKRKDVYR